MTGTDQMDWWETGRKAHDELLALSAEDGGSWWARLRRWLRIQRLIDDVRYCDPPNLENRDPRTLGSPRWYMGG